MECIEHFSHEHPLSFFKADDDDEDPKPYECHICGLPILSSPSYTCTNSDSNCNFFLHKACTQIPRRLYYHDHGNTLELSQINRPTSPRQKFTYNCTYKYRDHYSCGFEIHPLIAKQVEIKSQHRSHKSHPLVAFCRDITSLCDVCGKRETGFFFHCQICNFWIHQDCTILPTLLKIPTFPHPFILAYDPPFRSETLHWRRCKICKGSWHSNGVYFCGITNEVVHMACAKSRMDLQPETLQEFIQLPDEETTFPSLVIRISAKQNCEVKEIFHEHPLILGDREAARGDDLVCNVCIQPTDSMISEPFYICQSDGCHFQAHHICATSLPTRLTFVEFQAHHIRGDLCDSVGNFFNSVFPCIYCHRPSNGVAYRVSVDDTLVIGYCDVECASAPISIKHASHVHPLFRQLFQNSNPPSCCSGEFVIHDIYRCALCDFSIHIRCAMLPKTTRHKFDKHPLALITRPHNHNEDNMQVLFCEFCEQHIEPKYWYYGCHKCKQYFHIKCIPSVGYLSKVKFGTTLADDNIHLNHPLTLTQMLTHGTHERCAVCKQIIDASDDHEMALHCSPCHFWIHFSCAAGSMHYSKSLELYKCQFRSTKIELN